MTYERQTKITRVIIKAAVLMLEFGAESILVEQTASRLGKALGLKSVEVSMIPSAIVLSTLDMDRQSVTTTRRVHHKPINMSIVCDIQKLVIEVEKNDKDILFIIDYMKKITPNYYNRWLVVFMVGLACASFSHLQGADIISFFLTFFAASFGMFIRQELSKQKFVMFITFGITAFVITCIGSLGYLFDSVNTNVVLASSVLLLVPGFAYINSFLDALKGYLSMGWGRWLEGTLLIVSTSIGIILAMSILDIKGW